MLKYIFISIFTFIVLMADAQGVSEKFVYSGSAGNYILLDLDDKQLPGSDKARLVIERSRTGQNNFSKVGDFSPAKTYADFEKILGKSLALEIRNFLQVKSDQEVITQLNQKDALAKFGFYILNVDLLRAAGLIFLDVLPSQNVNQFDYRIVSDGRVIRQQTARAFQKSDLPKGKTSKILTTDSLIRVGWEFGRSGLKLPLLARVFYQEGAQGRFSPYPGLTVVNTDDGVLTAIFEERVRPEIMRRYFIVPVDIFGNEGMPSDTISAISVDFKKIAGIEGLEITDTALGLYCHWKPLAQKPYYTGIQILRSRDPMKDFIVLDSVPVSANSYLDKQVLPNVTYYYKFRPLVYKISGWGEVIATTASGTKTASKNKPLPPKNLLASVAGDNVELRWSANAEIDIFAYYVLRGTTEKNMEIISPAVKENEWTDTSRHLSGKINYVYSVIAVNNNQLKSDPSAPVGIRPERGYFIEPPSGISANATGAKVILQWPDMKKKEVSIAGYILYRKKVADKAFVALTNELITSPRFVDTTISPNTNYIYVVTSVDYSGYESSPSPEVTFLLKDMPKPPPSVYVRKTPDGVEVSWPMTDRTDIVSYNIYRRLPEEKNHVKLGSVKPNQVMFIDKKFAAGKVNVYSVTITTAGGESDKSIEKTLFVKK